MSEVKEVVEKVEEKRDNALYARVRKVETKLDKIVKWAEEHYGVDIDGDGKKGFIGIKALLLGLSIMTLCVVGAMAYDPVATDIFALSKAGDGGTNQVLQVSSNGNLKVSGTITSAGGLSGSLSAASLTAGTTMTAVNIASATNYQTANLVGTMSAANLTAGTVASAIAGHSITNIKPANFGVTKFTGTFTNVTWEATGKTGNWVFVDGILQSSTVAP